MISNNPSGRIDRESVKRQKSLKAASSRDRYMASLQASIERREKRRAAENEAGNRSALSAQEAAQQARRDKQQQLYEQANTGQRAYYAANDAADDFVRAQKLNKDQQKAVRRRDELQNSALMQRDSQQARDQRIRDKQQFGYKTQENDQQFGQQVYRDQLQHGNTMQRDQMQHGNTLERDYTQFGLDTRRADQQQRNTLERDYTQFGMDTERDQMQNEFQSQRDNRLNMFDVNRDARQQQYQQENQAQRETADVAARWNEQVQQARNMGMDFSEQQKKEMKDLDKAFRKNVLNGDLDPALQQQAMLHYQKKLSEFIPDERVQNPTDIYKQRRVFDEELGMYVMQGFDSKGLPTFEPWTNGSDPAQLQQQQMQMQEKERQLAEKKIERQQKAEFERLDKWQSVYEKHDLRENLDGTPYYSDEAAKMDAAKKEFERQEEAYRRNYNLPPLFPEQSKPDNDNPFRRSDPGRQVPKRDYSEQLPAPVQQQPTPFQPTTGPQPPAMSHKGPLPSHITAKLRSIPGGKDLQSIYEKHKSNDRIDQNIRMSAKIVINAMMTGDTSDEDYPEALDNLKRLGFKVGN